MGKLLRRKETIILLTLKEQEPLILSLNGWPKSIEAI